MPRLALTDTVLDEIEALVRAGREQITGVAGDGRPHAQAPAYTRPTLVVPSASTQRTPPVLQPSASFTTPELARRPEPDASTEREFSVPGSEPGLTCFRLEFESHPGPLDLRAVDDAVSEHPAVRDVALLDYDGRRATLKVWIAQTSSAEEVQSALMARAAQLFAPGHDVTIVALEDVA